MCLRTTLYAPSAPMTIEPSWDVPSVQLTTTPVSVVLMSETFFWACVFDCASAGRDSQRTCSKSLRLEVRGNDQWLGATFSTGGRRGRIQLPTNLGWKYVKNMVSPISRPWWSSRLNLSTGVLTLLRAASRPSWASARSPIADKSHETKPIVRSRELRRHVFRRRTYYLRGADPRPWKRNHGHFLHDYQSDSFQLYIGTESMGYGMRYTYPLPFSPRSRSAANRAANKGRQYIRELQYK